MLNGTVWMCERTVQTMADLNSYLCYMHIGKAHGEYHPELRVGQLMSNFEQWLKDTQGIDIFYIDNERFVDLLKEYLKGGADNE